jgi:SagB-type dehydrogenase family enzyme
VRPSLGALGALLHLSLGITAWKTFGPDRWAVRANPSSGNLHPVEAYVFARGVPELEAGIYHYRPEDHVLERRGELPEDPPEPIQLGVGFTSVMWREAWKYGERAFRYCQLDTGHAVAALSYAAAALGWRLSEQPQIGTESLGCAFGVDRTADFPSHRSADTEREEPEVLLSLGCDGLEPAAFDLQGLASASRWYGIASTIDAHPMYRWPIVAEVAAATRAIDAATSPRVPARRERTPIQGDAPAGERSVAEVILGRRSAQRFDARFCLDQADFFALLASALDDFALAGGTLARSHCIDLVLFVHRVNGLEPGVYLLGGALDGKTPLTTRLGSQFDLHPVAAAPSGLDLRRVAAVEARALARLAREVHCGQEIAAQASFVLAMVAEFDPVIEESPAAYRALHREAGLLGHVFYLQAEARSLRGTGIGCFFDDAFHELLKLHDTRFQTLYHFAIGKPVDDSRIETTPVPTPFLTDEG